MPTPKVYGPAASLDGAVEWLNCDEAPRLDTLRGKIVLLEFWAACCINCKHALTEVSYLEDKYAHCLVVIGIHSGKFETERQSSSLRQAIERNGIRHPVANDGESRIWKAYGAQAWPTLCLIDPEGNVVAAYAGEGNRDALDNTIGQIAAHHRAQGTLDEMPALSADTESAIPHTALRYPRKVLVDPDATRLFVADTNHNRILICDLQGCVRYVVGSGVAGLVDGSFEETCFSHPHGLALGDGVLYVADTENHAIRAVDLATQRTETFAGNGTQGSFRTMAGGPDTLLSSPWDVEMVGNMLYVAMAGTHQIWRAAVETRNFRVFAGSGIGNLVDGPGVSAQLAQPTGLTHAGRFLYFADSEVSAVRRANLRENGAIETLIGTGLFEFGDRIGPAETARLQRPLDVCWVDGKVFIADTYNHRIKILYPGNRTVEHFVGTGEAGCSDGREAALNEPRGVSVRGRTAFIADTNNHRIVKADLESREVIPLEIVFRG